MIWPNILRAASRKAQRARAYLFFPFIGVFMPALVFVLLVTFVPFFLKLRQIDFFAGLASVCVHKKQCTENKNQKSHWNKRKPPAGQKQNPCTTVRDALKRA